MRWRKSFFRGWFKRKPEILPRPERGALRDHSAFYRLINPQTKVNKR